MSRRARAAALLAAALPALVLLAGPPRPAGAAVPPVPIPQNPNDVAAVPGFIGAPQPMLEPIAGTEGPQDPWLAPNGRSNVHGDAYQTDGVGPPGPVGQDPQVISTYLHATCTTVVFDSKARLFTVCGNRTVRSLFALNGTTLGLLATLPLPPGTVAGSQGITGGSYFYLDRLDRAVIPTANDTIWVVALGLHDFQRVAVYNVSSAVGPGDGIVSILPDWAGRIWFVSLNGVIGFVDPTSGEVRFLRLPGERIANSFAVDETGGVFVVSDHALYRVDVDQVTGDPSLTWRAPYDRGPRQKPGQISYGSGTTPTLIGSRYVAIADNAAPRLHVLVYARNAGHVRPPLVCERAVFPAGRSATENSFIGVRDSLIVENNFGYTGPASVQGGGTSAPGITRVDFSPGHGCRVRWTDAVSVPTSQPKLSFAAGLVYTYAKDAESNGVDAWYVTAIDFATGHTTFQVLGGTGPLFDNGGGPVTLDPRGHVAYVGVTGGLVRLGDGP